MINLGILRKNMTEAKMAKSAIQAMLETAAEYTVLSGSLSCGCKDPCCQVRRLVSAIWAWKDLQTVCGYPLTVAGPKRRLLVVNLSPDSRMSEEIATSMIKLAPKDVYMIAFVYTDNGHERFDMQPVGPGGLAATIEIYLADHHLPNQPPVVIQTKNNV